MSWDDLDMWSNHSCVPLGNTRLEMPSQGTCFSIKAVGNKQLPIGTRGQIRHYYLSEDKIGTITWARFHSMNRLNKYRVFSLSRSFPPRKFLFVFALTPYRIKIMVQSNEGKRKPWLKSHHGLKKNTPISIS